MYKFGKTSTSRLETCHEDLQLIMNTAIKRSDVDFGITEGYRSVEQQQIYFKAGKSKVDGIKKKGKHNYSPSLAADIYAYVNGKSNYSEVHLAYLMGVITSTANDLYNQGRIDHKVRSGGNWDKDGEIVTDQSFQDLPHFELYKP